MKKKLNSLALFSTALIIISSLALNTSCSSSGSSAKTEEEKLAKESPIDGLVMVPLYAKFACEFHQGFSTKKKFNVIAGNYWVIPSEFGYMNSKGEWLMFDNDSDYSSLCKISAGVMIIWSWVYEDYREWAREEGINPDSVAKAANGYKLPIEYLDNPDKALNFRTKLNKEFNKLQQAVFLYFSGKKDEITDRNLFKIIDKFYYDQHPDDWYFYSSKNSYGFKSYESESDRRWSVKFKEYESLEGADGESWRMCTFDGVNVPEGAVIMSW